jgi:hypothetical protein
MNTRTVLSVSAVIALVYAFASLVMPTFIGPLYGFGTSPAEVLLARFFGVELLIIGLINWLMKDEDYATLRPVITGNLIGNAVGVIVSFMGTIGGVMNTIGWSSVAIYLVLALGFAYLQFMGQPVNMKAR